MPVEPGRGRCQLCAERSSTASVFAFGTARSSCARAPSFSDVSLAESNAKLRCMRCRCARARCWGPGEFFRICHTLKV